MKKKLHGTTLIYNETEETYLRTEIYMSDDPSETVELCVVDDEHPRFCDGEIDESSGPWRRIIEPKEDQGERTYATPAQIQPAQSYPRRGSERDEPIVLEKEHRKITPRRTRIPTQVLSETSPGAGEEACVKKFDKPVWVGFEAEVLGDDALVRVPKRLHVLAKASGDHVEMRMRLMPNARPFGANETLDGLPAIGRDEG